VSWVVQVPAGTDVSGPKPTTRLAGRAIEPRIVAAEAATVAEARRGAALRMTRPWSTPASDAALRTRARMETELEDDETGSAPVSTGRDAAAAVGTAVHRLLEDLDLSANLAGEVAEKRSAVLREVAAGLRPEDAAEAEARFNAVVDRLPGSGCLQRLAELAPGVAARELHVFALPEDDDGTSVVSGAVDLLYSDPDDGRLVIADYKTDSVETDDELAERCERYRPQLETYGRALECALDLDEEPHLELWFLRPDRIVRLR
jgi:ATP-dependent exoDNAse (exonuclease V) beta subunit